MIISRYKFNVDFSLIYTEPYVPMKVDDVYLHINSSVGCFIWLYVD